MSELKAGVMRTPHNEGMIFDRGSSRISVTEDETEFYLKSEVDEVIRHQKYKRCLIIISNIKSAIDNGFFVSVEYLDWLNKWNDRWLKIADQFKEAKCR